jgi:hypothetical protein
MSSWIFLTKKVNKMQPHQATVERWALAKNNSFIKHKDTDLGYLLFDTRKEAKEEDDRFCFGAQPVKVRITIRLALP